MIISTEEYIKFIKEGQKNALEILGDGEDEEEAQDDTKI